MTGMHDTVKIRLKGPSGKGDFLVEEINGDDWSRNRRKYVHKVRRIDRPGDTYQETVIDKESGEVIHHVLEPLHEHRPRGRAWLGKAKEKGSQR